MADFNAEAIGDPDFVYVIYIRAPREKVWAALTDNQAARGWWSNTRHDSSFEPGAPIRYIREGNIDTEGKVLEAVPPERLVYTFHVGGPGPMHDEGPSVVTHELSEAGEATQLKIIHSHFSRGSLVRPAISNGWPAILSGLKSLLETGKELDLGD